MRICTYVFAVYIKQKPVVKMLSNDFKFFSLHWQYIIAGAICYLSAKFFYSYLKNFKENIASQYQAPDQVAEVKEYDSEGSESESDETPALPKNLKHVPLNYKKPTVEESLKKSEEFYKIMDQRRTVRHFSTEQVPIEIIRNIIKVAGTAPSGAHTEPWTFIVISDTDTKWKIREIIEQEEEINYRKRMGKKWTTDLKPLRTNWIKEYLTDAPHLVLVFKQMYSFTADGAKKVHYYNEMSINIAAGMLITAVHLAGLVSLTSTPLNCGPALRALLGRPAYEKLVLLLPIGYPADGCLVPDLKRKPLDEILIEI